MLGVGIGCGSWLWVLVLEIGGGCDHRCWHWVCHCWVLGFFSIGSEFWVRELGVGVGCGCWVWVLMLELSVEMVCCIGC